VSGVVLGAEAGHPLLIRVSGRDRPSLTRDLLQLLGRAGAVLEDMEQLVVRERLTLDVLVRLDGADEGVDPSLIRDVLFWGFTNGLKVDFERVASTSSRAGLMRHAVTVLGRPLTPSSLAAVAEAIAATGGNIDRIVRLATDPVTAYDLVVIAGDVEAMRRELGAVAQAEHIDVAVQVNGLERRAKRLVVMDVDSTLIVDEVIELLADEAGCGAAVAATTARAMAGELDFEGSLRERVRLLAGLDEAALDRVRARIRLTPGARTFVRTLKRLGFVVGVVSGGFTPFTDFLRVDLGLDHAYANTLEVRDGRLTGEVLGTVVDRARKAELLAQIAAQEGVPLSQTVAVGDGANDLDMLAAAGLGIAFNAKPVVRAQADTTVSVPYLDAILFMLGIRGADVERVTAAETATTTGTTGPTGASA
jgi:phosphoserine phosphatase